MVSKGFRYYRKIKIMSAGVEAFKSGMDKVEADIREKYPHVDRVSVMDIDCGMFSGTNAAGVVSFTDEKPSMGFDVFINQDASYSSISHEGRQENIVNLFPI